MTPEEVVRQFYAALERLNLDEIVDFFTVDACYHNMPAEYEKANGRDAVAKVIADFVSHLTLVEVEILNISVTGNLVFVERVDHCEYGGNMRHAPIVGVLDVEGEKIKEWREYFDSKMPA